MNSEPSAVNDTDGGNRKRRKKSKKYHHKESVSNEDDENNAVNETKDIDNEDSAENKSRKRKKSKRHADEGLVTADVNNKQNDLNEENGIEDPTEIKKKKKKNKKHKKKELLSEDVEMNQEMLGCKEDGIEAEENVNIEKKESGEFNEFLKSKNRIWPKSDILKLLVSIETNLLNSTEDKNNDIWKSVEFDSYTHVECKAMYKLAVSKIRKTRTMLEIVKEAIELLPTLTTVSVSGKALTKPKPITPLKLYMESHYKKFSKKNPELRQIEILNHVSKQWLSLDDKKKGKYISQALAGEKKYLEQVGEYRKIHPLFVAKPILTKIEQKIHFKTIGVPDRPCSNSFGLFVKVSKHLLPGVSGTERLRGLSKIYNDLPAAVKEDYENRIKLEKQTYQTKLTEYVTKLSPEDCLLSVNSKLVKDQQKFQKTNKHPANNFALYYREQKDSLPDLSKSEKHKALQERWKLLPKVVRETYNKQKKKIEKQCIKEENENTSS